MSQLIHLEIEIEQHISLIWRGWNDPDHIKEWCFNKDKWKIISAKINLKNNQEFFYKILDITTRTFSIRKGKYIKIIPRNYLEYIIDQGTKTILQFVPHKKTKNCTILSVDMESLRNGTDSMKKEAWKQLLQQFKRYMENGKL